MASELRKFGLLVGSVFIGVFGLLLPFLKSRPLPPWPYIVGGPLILLGLVFPIALKPIHIVWMKIGGVLGWINTRIILTLIYFLIFTPIGWMMRLMKKDPLDLALVKQANTYWSKSDTENLQQMERPF